MADDATRLPFITKLEEVLSKKEDLLMAFLLDGSGSMSGMPWETLRETLLVLIDKIPGVTCEVIQFGTGVQLVCPWTPQTDRIRESCQKPTRQTAQSPGRPGMEMIGGSTNMCLAFEELRLSFLRVITEDSRPVVIFITDGQPDRNPHKEIEKFLAIKPAPTIIGVGVGEGTSVTQLGRLLPGQPVFHVSNFASLASMVNRLAKQEPVSKNQDLFHLEFYPSERVQHSKEPLCLRFALEPGVDMEGKDIPAGSKLKFLGNAYYFGEIVDIDRPAKKDSPYQGTVQLKVTADGKTGHAPLPELLSYSLTVPGVGIYKGSLNMRLAWLTKDFLGTPEYNILINGSMGSGKTSLLNGLANLFGIEEKLQKYHLAFKDDGHVTTKYTCFPMAHHIDENTDFGYFVSKNLRFRFWDSWGINGHNYDALTFVPFLRGTIPDGMEMPPDIEGRPTPVPQGMIRDVDPLAVIHAVLFVMPIGTALEQEKLDIMRNHIKMILRRGIRPLIVVTFAGTIASEKELEESYQRIVNATGLEVTDVVLIDNYTSELLRNMQKDLKYWEILAKILDECKKNWMRFSEQREHRNPMLPLPGTFEPKSPNLIRTATPQGPPQAAIQGPPQAAPRKQDTKEADHRHTVQVAASSTNPVIEELSFFDPFAREQIGTIVDVDRGLNLITLRRVAEEQGTSLAGYKFFNGSNEVITNEATYLVRNCLVANGDAVNVSKIRQYSEIELISQSGRNLGTIPDTTSVDSLAKVRIEINTYIPDLGGRFEFVNERGEVIARTQETQMMLYSVISRDEKLQLKVEELVALQMVNETTGETFSVPTTSSPSECTLAQLRRKIMATGYSPNFVFVSQRCRIGYTPQLEERMTVDRVAINGDIHIIKK